MVDLIGWDKEKDWVVNLCFKNLLEVWYHS